MLKTELQSLYILELGLEAFQLSKVVRVHLAVGFQGLVQLHLPAIRQRHREAALENLLVVPHHQRVVPADLFANPQGLRESQLGRRVHAGRQAPVQGLASRYSLAGLGREGERGQKREKRHSKGGGDLPGRPALRGWGPPSSAASATDPSLPSS